ncbi:response regulator [Candidatus Omnitrophota bacterium]
MKKILIVDDDHNMRHAINRILTLEKKYEIYEAIDGVEAEEKIVEIAPDLVILDIKMPGKDGYEVCLNVRRNPLTQKIKVVAITGYSGKIGQGIMEALGADAFFEKPFDTDTFKTTIADLLTEA